jgi:hypothetical protein
MQYFCVVFVTQLCIGVFPRKCQWILQKADLLRPLALKAGSSSWCRDIHVYLWSVRLSAFASVSMHAGDDAMSSSADEESADEWSADDESADEGSADEESADKGSADEESADEESADEWSADEESADEGSADEESADKGSADEESADEESADEWSADEEPADEVSAEDEREASRRKEELTDLLRQHLHETRLLRKLQVWRPP